MKIIPASPASLQHAIGILSAGGIVIHATETCYGIACDLTHPEAVTRLFAVKKRPPSQPVSALFPTLAAAREYVVFSPRAEAIAENNLPGPLTLVLPMKEGAPLISVAPADRGPPATIGVRVSSHPFATELAIAFGKPIATTSANLHGKDNPYSVADIQSQFGDQSPQPDLVIDGGTLPHAPPSTVVEVIGDTLKVLRQGALVVA